MRNYAKFLSHDKVLQLIKIIIILSLSIMMGLIIATRLRMSIMLIASAIFFVALWYFGLNFIIIFLALAWWMPIDLNLSFLGNYAYNLTIPEAVAYVGLVLLPLSIISKKSQVRQSALLDPTWIFLIILLLGGLIASANIKTLDGYAMLRRSTFLFISVIIVCRYLLTTQRQIFHLLNLLLISNCLFIAFILIAPNFPGIFFEKALSYINTSRLGGIYIIPRIGNFYFGPNNISLIMGMGGVIALTFALNDTGLKKRIMAGAVFLLNMIVLAMTGSRASIVSTMIAIIPIILYALWTQKKTKVIPYAAVLILGLMIVLPKFISIETRERIQSATSISNDPSGQTRLFLLEKGIDLFRRNPFGIGYGNFVTLNDNFIMWEQNLLLNTALGGGFLSLVGLLGFFFILFWRGASKLISESKEIRYICIASLGASLAFFINSMLSDPNAETSVYFSWVVLGITFASVSMWTKLPKTVMPGGQLEQQRRGG